MEIAGTLINILPIQTGQGKKGTWQRQDIILQVGIDNKTVCVSLWNKLADEKLELGDTVKASVNIESREYNGKWYTDIKAWSIERKCNDFRPPEPLEVCRPNNVPSDGDMALNPIYSGQDDIELPF